MHHVQFIVGVVGGKAGYLNQAEPGREEQPSGRSTVMARLVPLYRA